MTELAALPRNEMRNDPEVSLRLRSKSRSHYYGADALAISGLLLDLLAEPLIDLALGQPPSQDRPILGSSDTNRTAGADSSWPPLPDVIARTSPRTGPWLFLEGGRSMVAHVNERMALCYRRFPVTAPIRAISAAGRRRRRASAFCASSSVAACCVT